MLIIRPQPIVGESWQGYLLRLAENNHLGGIVGLAKLLGLKQVKLMVANPGEILKLLKINNHLYEPEDQISSIGKLHRLSMHGRSMRSRICPRCVECSENFHIPASWDQTFRLVCEKHQIRLMDKCLSCNQLISYGRKSLTHCDCGYAFGESHSRLINFSLDRFLSICELQDQYANPPLTFAKKTFEDTEAYLLCRRLLRLSGNLSNEEVRNWRYVEAFATVDDMQLIAGWFEDWPRNINEFLKIYFPIPRHSMYEVLFGRQTRPGLTFQTVRSVVSSFLDRNKQSQRINLKSLYPKKNEVALSIAGNKEYVSLHFVIRTTGCRYENVKFWMEKGWLGDVKVLQISPNKIEYQVRQGAAQKAIQIIKSTSSREEVSLSLGLKSKAIRYIKEAGFLTGIQYCRSIKQFRLLPSEVFGLARSLLQMSSPKILEENKRTYFSSLITYLGEKKPHLLKSLLTEILNGRFTLHTLTDNALDLSELYLIRAELHAWRLTAKSQYADA